MKEDSKIINIYIDKNKALYGAPFGHSEKYGKRPIDKLFLLMPGYSDEMLCEFVNRLFEEMKNERLLVPSVFASEEQILAENKLMIEYLKTGADEQDVKLFFSNISK